MSFEVIRIRAALGRDDPERDRVGPDPARWLTSARDLAPVAFLIRSEDLPGLDGCRDLIVDRGRKHPAKPLAAVMLDQERIPLIRGDHTTPGQLLRSVRALLTRAVDTGDRNVFLIGADPGPFTELWRRAGGRAAQVPDPAEPEAQPSTLFRMLAELPVPDGVLRQFVGVGEEVQLVRQLILRAARQDDPVLILGDTGTGKEVVARLIHDQSGRRNQAFTAVNCGAIPRELLESELFGYEKGSHSTAVARRQGLWRTAEGGTLFLDEIADLSLDHQVKIFRALELGEVRPLGAEREVRVNARVIAATNRDLFTRVRSGEFREDLYYRLRGFMIRTPALRDHPQSIPQLAACFWQQVTRGRGDELPEGVLSELARYRWPGNARELRMVLASLHALFGTENLAARHVRAVFEFEGQALAAGGAAGAGELGHHRVECLRRLRRADEILRATEVTLTAAPADADAPDPTGPLRQAASHRGQELELLCRQPLLFHDMGVFRAVRRVYDRLSGLETLLAADAGDHRLTHWRQDLKADIEAALSRIFEEVEDLLSLA